MEDTSTGTYFVPQKRQSVWRTMTGALHVRNFRLFATGQFFASTAVWTMRITQDWLVFELTGSVSAVGFLILMQFGPTLLFGLHAGVLVDRVSKRMLVAISQSLIAVSALSLAVLSFTGALSTWHLFVFAGVVGLVTVIDQPARQVFVNELVGRQLLMNAVSTNAAVFQTASMIGPAISGVLLITWGGGGAFLAAFVGVCIALCMLALLRTDELHKFPAAPRSKGQIREALTYIAGKPVIFWTFVTLSFVTCIGLNWSVLLAPMAEHAFSSGASGYASFNSSVAAGAIIGAILSMQRKNLRLRSFFLSVLGLSFFKTVASFMPSEPLFMIVLALSGLSMVLMWTAVNGLAQGASNMLVRGRVMAVYMLIATGGQALGGVLLGMLADAVGARAAMLLSGSIPLVATLVIALIVVRVHRIPLNSFVRPAPPAPPLHD